MTALRVTRRQAARWRLRRQLLTDPLPDPVEIARRLCGVHAQVASAGALIAGVRSDGPADLGAALWTDRTLVRTWAMRGTLHLLPADELDLWVGALTDRESRRRFPPSWEREHGATAAQLHAVTDAIGAVLGATPRTRAELVADVSAHLGDPALAGPLTTGWGAMLKPAAARGLLCSGPTDGGTVTFVSPEAWLGRPLAPRAPEAAAREVLSRFLVANGPATAADVARWWGEQPAPARRWIRANADVLTEVEVDGEGGYVVRAEDADELAAAACDDPADPLLLPAFDPWVIAPISHRRWAVPAGREADVSRTAGWISPVLVVDGSVAGVWQYEIRGDTVLVDVRGFARVPAAVRRGAERHAGRYAHLLGADGVEVRWA